MLRRGHAHRLARFVRRVGGDRRGRTDLGLVDGWRHRVVEGSEIAGREDRIVGKELVSELVKDRRSLAVEGSVVAAVEDKESGMEEERRSLGFEEEGLSSLVEEDSGLEAGCSLAEKDIAVDLGADSFLGVGNLAGLHRRRRNSLS